MKLAFKTFGNTLIMLTMVACQNSSPDPYIKPCAEALKTLAKTFGFKVDKSDKLQYENLCTCKSRGLQTTLTSDGYDGLLQATNAGKARAFQGIEKNYLKILTLNDRKLRKEVETVKSVCENYASNVRLYRRLKNEPPALPY